ncbi:MAG: CPBP family intramembrane metalloprotease [Chloroflexi bacterium]|nr:CPBP family intramembrane metalloprotease [Chloroflexota bacterium]
MSNINTHLIHEPVINPDRVKKTSALLGILIVSTPLLILGTFGEWLGDGMAPGAIVLNIGYALSMAVATIVLKQRGSGWRKIGLARPASWPKTMLLAVGTVVIYIVVANILIPAFLQLLPLPTIAPADKSGYDPLYNNFPLLLLYVAAAWTVIPFGEEMLFRAFLMDSLALFFKNSKARWALTVIGSSVLFGLAHFSWGLAGVIETTIMGFVLGSIFLGTKRNLWVTIIAHGILNTIVFVLIYSGVI